MKPSGRRGLGWVYQRGRIWWVQYSYLGKVSRESSGSDVRSEAVKILRRRLAEMARGRPVGRDVERTTFETLSQMLLDDYRNNDKRSLDRAARSVAHLGQTFGMMRALDITMERILAYVRGRKDGGASNATINRELAALKRMFRLGEQAERVFQRPHVPMLREDNVRKGFFERPEFKAVLAQMPDELRPAFEVAYATGWRVKSEILTRQTCHLDMKAGWLRLEPGETKNREGRMFPLTPELRALFERQLMRNEAIQRETGQIIPWLFHRNGVPIRSFRRAWVGACQRAGLVGRIPHDFRRTAVRNLERAGVPRSAAMAMVGHKTESIYRRYAIADETMLRESGEKLAGFHRAELAGESNVIALKQRTPKKAPNGEIARF